MSKKKVFAGVAAVAEFVGIGMIFGYLLGEGTNNVAVWVGGILVFLGAIALGMAISAQDDLSAGKPSSPTEVNKTSHTKED